MVCLSAGISNNNPEHSSWVAGITCSYLKVQIFAKNWNSYGCFAPELDRSLRSLVFSGSAANHLALRSGRSDQLTKKERFAFIHGHPPWPERNRTSGHKRPAVVTLEAAEGETRFLRTPAPCPRGTLQEEEKSHLKGWLFLSSHRSDGARPIRNRRTTSTSQSSHRTRTLASRNPVSPPTLAGAGVRFPPP